MGDLYMMFYYVTVKLLHNFDNIAYYKYNVDSKTS